MNQFIFTHSRECIGCKACEVACMLAHNKGRYPLPGQDVPPRISVQRAPDSATAVMCHHCDKAPCVTRCPTGALYFDKQQVMLETRHCIGCKECLLVCPFGAITLQEGTLAAKCDLCQHYSGGPACIAACPTRALVLFDTPGLEQLRDSRQRETLNGQESFRLSARIRLLETNTPRSDAHKQAADERKSQFTEIYSALTRQQAYDAASRCLVCAKHANCRRLCPLHNAIPDLISLVREERIMEAVELSHQTSSLPEICGRVCPQEKLCESDCTLAGHGGAVTIGNLEKYITDEALKAGWRPDLSGIQPRPERVAIIGAGPAGLGCADVLARHGIKAVVYDRRPEIGGLLTFGIPPFKLEKSLLSRRREIFSDMGIEFVLDCEVGRDISLSNLLTEFDALFIAPGTYRPMAAGLEHESAPGVLAALPYLTANIYRVMGLPEDPNHPYIDLKQQRVLVLGGGDTAMDCLRTAVRQGARSVTCAYRRDEANMPGSRKEVKNAREEGVQFLFNVQPQRIVLNKKGAFAGVEMLHTRLAEADTSGRRRPEVIAGSEFIVEADALILAFGFQPHAMPWLSEAGVECDKWGQIIIGQHPHYPGLTTHPRIFAGGDAVRGADLVVTAMADGRRAASDMIDMFDRQRATREVS